MVAVTSSGTTGGANAIEQIARTLTWQGAFVVATLGIAAPRTKSDPSGRLTDPATLQRIEALNDRLIIAGEGPDETRLGDRPSRSTATVVVRVLRTVSA